MSENILEVEDLYVLFKLHGQGFINAVDGVSFRVPRAKTVALVGESGSGKSVIAQSIMRLLPKQALIGSGHIRFYVDNNQPPLEITQLSPSSRKMRSLRGGNISMIFQEPMVSLSPLHTIGDQIIEAVYLHQKASKAEARECVEQMLDMVGFPDPVRAIDTYPFELSGGLRQRAMIAMALVCRPQLLIADEPTTALDVTIQAQILGLLKNLQQQLNMAVLLITHDLGVVANMADEVVVIYHGKLMESGSIRDLYRNPRHPYLKALMQAVPRIGMDRDQRLVSVREARQPAVSRGSSTDSEIRPVIHPQPDATDIDTPLLRVQNLCKTYNVRKSRRSGDADESVVRALDDVSFEVRRGECLGLVGESGCGKTTVTKIITRTIEADGGDVLYHSRGHEVDLLEMTDLELFPFRRKIQYVFQDPISSLNPRMTVFDIIREPLYIHQIGESDERSGIVQGLMNQVGLDPRFLSRYPHSFSGGQRQRIGIARALALNPELILCDEPVSALDVSVQAQILNLLKDLQRDLSLTYLFISHNLAVVDYMADRIAVMCAGKLVEIADRETLFQNPVHPYTRSLLAAIPRSDLDCPLDFRSLMEGRISDPAEWPHPFGHLGDARPEMIEVDAGHQVRALPELIS